MLLGPPPLLPIQDHKGLGWLTRQRVLDLTEKWLAYV